MSVGCVLLEIPLKRSNGKPCTQRVTIKASLRSGIYIKHEIEYNKLETYPAGVVGLEKESSF